MVNCQKIKSAHALLNYVNWLKPFTQIDIMPDEKVNSETNLKDFDAVVITGSAKFAALNEVHKGLLSFLKTVCLPTIGICYGHQVICLAHGCKVVHSINPIKGAMKIRILDPNELFINLGHEIVVDESHFDSVVWNSDLFKKIGLKLLANSESCQVEAVKHVKRPIYGVQFHPERSGKTGLKIAENFYKYVVKK